MPSPSTLRVLLRERIEDPFSDEPVRSLRMVPDLVAQKAGVRKFHGLRHDPKAGPEFTDPKTLQVKNHGGFVGLRGEVIALPITTENLRALRDGDFWAADEATARVAGVSFDPTFGGEHPPITPASAPKAEAPAVHEER